MDFAGFKNKIKCPIIKELYTATIENREKFQCPRMALTAFEGCLNNYLRTSEGYDSLEAHRYITYCNLIELQYDEIRYNTDFNNDGVIGFNKIKLSQP